MTGNALLIAAMAPLLGRIRWLFALTADRDPHVEYAQHVTLCEAISSGNPELAAPSPSPTSSTAEPLRSPGSRTSCRSPDRRASPDPRLNIISTKF